LSDIPFQGIEKGLMKASKVLSLWIFLSIIVAGTVAFYLVKAETDLFLFRLRKGIQ